MEHSEHSSEAYMVTRWQQFCAGDRNAFAEITELNYISLYHYGTRFTADRDMIKDCLQDLFLAVWEKRESLTGIAAIRPYLFQSLRNNLVRRSRRQSVFSEISGYEPFDEISPESDWIINETDQLTSTRLRQAIESLPKRQKEALYLKYYENLSYEEIAVVMGLQRQAVANYLQYGIQKLREYWHHAAVFLILLSDISWY
ncbi:RNA polymerase sigma factor [Dyadobacter aurulentus]|uniref:RNA polymerase sigma factor n=1 Tax=Dyadobacter sp. UC 10 TaxID=2605428 RepID=UPI0011F14248|nr:RNA polymerase sigma factor [Dyadobacter sp. UC 10]KAA0991229.1 RNA polymerase sigma factor [Dyadobacter sp. UC 10]